MKTFARILLAIIWAIAVTVAAYDTLIWLFPPRVQVTYAMPSAEKPDCTLAGGNYNRSLDVCEHIWM